MATARPAPRLVVTTGDPCGVGPELLVAALGSTRGAVAATVLGRTSLLDAACGCLERAGPLSAALAARFRARLGSRVRVVETTAPPHWSRPGHWDERNVEYLRESLDRSIELAASTGSGLVTGPCDKRFFAALGMSGAGHTEYLALRLGGREPLMLFDSPRLRVALLTRHVPLHAVTGLATRERLAAAVARLSDYLRRAGPRPDPRPMALAGLDPHCGEWGGVANTDLAARGWVEELRGQGFDIQGPFSADTLCVPARLRGLGALLCWYHDQGLIPIKLLAFRRAVNLTLGLPVLRGSPAHGPAYDLAWRGQASPESLRRAVALVGRLAGRFPPA